ncbi:TetR family transcriptional regulator [Cohnella terricola]|uniref:TetR/AcrR family transcriptional regulator n=1 Tax=Cohnella terricola TaxID=1289167 RepID=A0A559JIR0_9BACL|nr:TetR family transcriptional regulator [Cohnella terricola]TVX99760.1 TetR/AcrR family transcriptional regulator [Cohnella terricola]
MSPKITETHRENKRKEILEAAKRVFIRQGYLASTMKDVVEESGLSRGGVYLYFSSTEEMLLDMFQEGDHANDVQVEDLLTSFPTVWTALNALFDHLQEELLHVGESLIPVLYEALMAGWRKLTYADLMNVRYANAVVRIAEMLQEGIRRGEFRPLVDVDTMARMFITLNDGIMVEAIQFGAEHARTKKQIDAFRQAFKHLLGITEEETPNERIIQKS